MYIVAVSLEEILKNSCLAVSCSLVALLSYTLCFAASFEDVPEYGFR